MAQTLASTASGTSAPPDDLVVILNPLNLGFAEYRGPRALLEAEGLIPQGTDWPQAYDDLYWQAGRFKYWLRRHRPDGAKGPRRAFADVDWFHLRQELVNGPSFTQRKIDIKAREIRAMVYRCSAQGQAELSAHWNRYVATMKDEAFQTFKASIPGLVRPKRAAKTQKGATHV